MPLEVDGGPVEVSDSCRVIPRKSAVGTVADDPRVQPVLLRSSAVTPGGLVGVLAVAIRVADVGSRGGEGETRDVGRLRPLRLSLVRIVRIMAREETPNAVSVEDGGRPTAGHRYGTAIARNLAFLGRGDHDGPYVRQGYGPLRQVEPCLAGQLAAICAVAIPSGPAAREDGEDPRLGAVAFAFTFAATRQATSRRRRVV